MSAPQPDEQPHEFDLHEFTRHAFRLAKNNIQCAVLMAIHQRSGVVGLRHCFCPAARLAEATGFDERSIKRAVSDLVARGVIEREVERQEPGDSLWRLAIRYADLARRDNYRPELGL